MSIDLTKIRTSSFTPGLQNVGTTSTTATVNGLLPANGTLPGNLVGSFLLYFPSPNIISVIRINLPDAHGDLATFWFPVMGTVQLYDSTSLWYLTVAVQNNVAGRAVTFNFLNNNTQDFSFSNFRIQAYAHLYTYPWAKSTL